VPLVAVPLVADRLVADRLVAVPLVAVPLVAVPLVAVPLVAVPLVAVPLVAVPLVAVPLLVSLTKLGVCYSDNLHLAYTLLLQSYLRCSLHRRLAIAMPYRLRLQSIPYPLSILYT